MLQKDPANRPTWKDLGKDPWLTKDGSIDWQKDVEYDHYAEQITETEIKNAYSAVEKMVNIKIVKKK